jgi:hypothetical protein
VHGTHLLGDIYDLSDFVTSDDNASDDGSRKKRVFEFAAVIRGWRQ